MSRPSGPAGRQPDPAGVPETLGDPSGGGGGPEVNEMDVDHSSTSPVGPLVTGAVMLIVGVVLLQQTFTIKGEGLSPEGPRFFPFVVISLWIVFSLVYLAQQGLRMLRDSGTLPAERFTHLGGAAALVVMLVIYAYALDPLGYLLATPVFFVGAAWAMSSRQVLRDAVIAIGLTVVVYFVFTQSLGVHLPAGVLGL